MRVISLAPSATATLAAMGAADLLVGVTVHCSLGGDETAVADTEPDAAAVGADRPERVGGWLNPDFDRVAACSPDLICTSDPLQREVRDALRDRGFDVFHREPATLDDAVVGFAALGEAVGRPADGERLARDARNRLRGVRDAVADRDRPTVYCEEWSNPPMAGGNWVPEAVAAAGGQYPFCDPGERSREVTGEEVAAADPDHAVLHLCGHGETVDPDTFRDRGWVPDAAVHVLDDSLLNQPSPRLIEGIERLAEILHGVDVAETVGTP